MIATGLIFALGLLVASLLFLLFLPILWRKAQRLARRDFEATIPASMNEIRAEVDRVRAEAAVQVRRGEILAGEMRETAARERAEAGRIVRTNVELAERNRLLQAQNDSLADSLTSLEAQIAAMTDEKVAADALYADLQRGSDIRGEEMEALAVRYRSLEALADEQRTQIALAQARTAEDAAELRRLSALAAKQPNGREDPVFDDFIELEEDADAGRPSPLAPDDDGRRDAAAVRSHAPSAVVGADAPAGSPPPHPAEDPDRSAADLRGSDEEAGENPPPAAAPLPAAAVPASAATANGRLRAALVRRRSDAPVRSAEENADIRDRIGDIAARVIRMTAVAEGPASPLARLVEPSAGGEAANDRSRQPTLAERVRILMRDDPPDGSGAPEKAVTAPSAAWSADAARSQPKPQR